jgi:7-carboxy-7-deazaguanine synthase
VSRIVSSQRAPAESRSPPSGSHVNRKIAAEELRVTEIFLSLQGETRTTGLPTVFVRLTGCPLRCRYCDTEYAFTGGQRMGLDDILERVRRYHVRHVTVTGGEPLAQRHCLVLLEQLCHAGFDVSLETSGALDISAVDPRVTRVMDLKTPASGESSSNRFENIEHLLPHDQVKFVICDREDYLWARQVIAQQDLTARCEVLVSSAHGRIDPAQLAEWVLEDRLPVRFQVQLHKILWGDEPGR